MPVYSENEGRGLAAHPIGRSSPPPRPHGQTDHRLGNSRWKEGAPFHSTFREEHHQPTKLGLSRTVERAALVPSKRCGTRELTGTNNNPAIDTADYTTCRADLVTTLLEPPWRLLPPHWNNSLAAGWYQRTHGKDPNVTGAAVSVWDEELADGITAKHVTPMTDEEKPNAAKTLYLHRQLQNLRLHILYQL